MRYEVELKFPSPDVDRLRGELDALGATPGAALEQSDCYYAHPVRDFKQTDEAFRIRCVGRENFVTYKGPLLDPQTKTRHEIEVPFATGGAAAEQLHEMFERLGFRPVRKVQKTRLPFELSWEDRHVELALDQVEGLGSFCEIEIMAQEHERDQARDALLRLARRLGLAGSERRSYLALLLERDHATGDAKSA